MARFKTTEDFGVLNLSNGLQFWPEGGFVDVLDEYAALCAGHPDLTLVEAPDTAAETTVPEEMAEPASE